MFKHSHSINQPKENVVLSDATTVEKQMNVPERATVQEKDTTPSALRELLEKNLKWSQIIYEQNRKLNNKLLWMAVSSWLRMLLIVVPLILGILYLPSLFQKLQGQYGSLLNSAATGKTSPDSIESLLKILPLNDIQRQQLKTILK